MGPKVELLPTRDKGKIMGVLSSPGIWENISGDSYMEPEGFNLKFDLKTVFILGVVDGEIIGCAIAHKEQEWKTHLNVIPEYREKHANEFAKLFLDWIWARIKPNKVVAEIHPRFESIIKFAEKLGYKQIPSDGDKNLYELVRT